MSKRYEYDADEFTGRGQLAAKPMLARLNKRAGEGWEYLNVFEPSVNDFVILYRREIDK